MNIPIRICNYVIFLFKIKLKRSLEILTAKMIELLGNSKSKINKNKLGKNVPHLENPEVV